MSKNVLLPVLILVALFCLATYWHQFHNWGRVALPSENVGLKIFDRQDQPVYTLLADRKLTPVRLGKIAKNFQNAIISIEDRNFYRHAGVSVEGIARATLANIKAGHIVQGGSTITQQLVKNLYAQDRKRDFFSKLKEAVMAMELEEHYSKDKILESYLNWVYFGKGAYGIEQAAQTYFGKHASEINLSQSAYLAGIVNAPSRLSINRKDGLERQHEVLDSMVEQRYITSAAAKKAKAEKLIFKNAPAQQDRYAYYLNYVVAQLRQEKFTDDELWNQGTRVFTNLDTKAQALAADALNKGISKAPAGVSQGALVSISVKDGAVIAMVGGIGSFDKSPWNRAISPHTAGSAFKPFVYLTGLQSGVIKPDSTVYDAPLEIDIPGQPTYAPKNFDGGFLGLITIRKALALSRNTCAIRVTQAVTPENIVATASQAGITSHLEPTLALGLGASAVSPLDMANSYATLARSGVRITPSFIRKVESKDKKIIRQYAIDTLNVFEAEPVAQLVDAMQDVVQRGTGTHAKLFGRPVAGKTGTADGARDIWFIGFTPDTVTAVWGGNDKNLPIAGKQVTGGAIMAGIWQNYMMAYYKTHPTPPGAFVAPREPLAQELEEIYYLPEPASIYERVTGFVGDIFGGDDAGTDTDTGTDPDPDPDPDPDTDRDNGIRDNGIRQYGRGRPRQVAVAAQDKSVGAPPQGAYSQTGVTKKTLKIKKVFDKIRDWF